MPQKGGLGSTADGMTGGIRRMPSQLAEHRLNFQAPCKTVHLWSRHMQVGSCSMRAHCRGACSRQPGAQRGGLTQGSVPTSLLWGTTIVRLGAVLASPARPLASCRQRQTN